jgi:hypothetical protein
VAQSILEDGPEGKADEEEGDPPEVRPASLSQLSTLSGYDRDKGTVAVGQAGKEPVVVNVSKTLKEAEKELGRTTSTTEVELGGGKARERRGARRRSTSTRGPRGKGEGAREKPAGNVSPVGAKNKRGAVVSSG